MDETSLLETYKPFLKYDWNEGYFIDSADQMMVAPRNSLRSLSGQVIASVGPATSSLQDFLVPAGHEYPGTSIKAAKWDNLSVPDRNYRDVYRALRKDRPKLKNIVYGRLVDDWIQYWFWSFYNDLRAGPLGLGLHEGDWEGIELHLTDGKPDLAVYAQHTYGDARWWDEVEKHGERPVVYSALGSHASYFDDGMALTHWHRTEHFVDRTAVGRTPKDDVRVEVLSEETHPWLEWPGTWGDTRQPKTGFWPYREISGDSPIGPGVNPRWRNPGQLLQKAKDAGRGPDDRHALPEATHDVPAALVVSAERQADKVLLHYEAEAGKPPPTKLLVTVNSPDDAYPPATFEVPVTAAKGTVEVPHELAPDQSYELHTSGRTDEGTLSPVTESKVARWET